MQPSFGGRRKWFLLVRETNQGGGAAMSADTCPGLSTGPLLPGDSGWFWDLWLKGVLSGCQDFTGGGVVRREGRREGEKGRWALDFLKRPPKNNGFCESRHSKRCVQGHECICAKGNVFYGKLTPVKLNICSKGNSSS